ncbi:MAG: preprotein translocase subunit SecE [Elusimicrobia bacterium RIFCSPLOWO2_02_FULL_39_32]|nr:MAG: preprotein translocase subunit SecE [Elusimicrobia bacterium GWA2_38_7]OGR81560.1 MAG: preprotein translocase subunit SecE [Elusimicrobia bacterium RIFCSPHIGHO2_02_FULL_39_36]OGR91604.1 MAG: preprotein translocase subunit SecE [Elusimicrobia bacterium RIFCSPLOWO2_02_FULL_39_32]OGR98831.1 MAG: preprotein translocase subunit SecE [Elusimicrobia bacterium RIFCSPLOWO2_12_FULL_39_28]
MEKIRLFFKESYEELKKVTWLSRKEVMGSTIVIIVLVAIIAVYISLVDFVFTRFISWIL